MLKIAVLDDQEEYVKQIHKLTVQSLQELGVPYRFKKYTQVKDLLSDLQEKVYSDIYLLDVEMPELSGLEVARNIRRECWSSVIIYITNYVQYAIEAFEVKAYRYIPKSVLDEKLPEVLMALIEEMGQEEGEFYKIEKHYQFERIPYHEIYYLKKEEKYVQIVHKRGKSKVRKSLADLLDEMGSRDYFLKIDRSYVVNILHIMALKDQQILLRDGSAVPVSKPRLAQVRQEVGKYWR